jgi:predicted metal-dependent HD superfamily phosphohydrolase
MLIQDLFPSWLQVLQSLQVDSFQVDRTLASTALAELVQAYTQPDRYYHNLHHIQQVLSTIERLQPQKDSAAILLAAWFHDVVYDPQAKDNEEKSAAFANHWLGRLDVPSETIATVTRLILNTQRHQCDAGDLASQILLDADLAILGADFSEYRRYARAIRQEYCWLSESEYLAGRRRVLEQFLQRDRLYFTPTMFEAVESAARQNLRSEIEAIAHRTNNQTNL